jgi:oligosaccharide 4-alpha-D-glucosyltransferase
MVMRRFLLCLPMVFACTLLSVHAAAFETPLEYRGHQFDDQVLAIDTGQGRIRLSFYTPAVVEVFHDVDNSSEHPSRTLSPEARPVDAQLKESDQQLQLVTDQMTVIIDKPSLRLSFLRDGEVFLAEEAGAFLHRTLRGFRFALDADEKLLGTGERVLGMDRRGHRLPLENKPHYGYGTESQQMYFSLAGVLSSHNYMLIFDNAARGHIDLGATEPDVLQFEAAGGRLAYLVAAGDSYPHTLAEYIEASGRPPMPPRWALGNYASRFGYRTESEAREVVQMHIDQGFPLDAIVIDLYWFGPDIQGHMGDLAWDRDAWPDPEGMMADFRKQGVKTILVTEPFILTSSERWAEAVDEQVLALNMAREPMTFDFYFGNTGLLDFFKPATGEWFWSILHTLMEQGVAGWWGDLGEPEVHPPATRHVAGMANEVHNAYGHHWAKSIFERHVRDYPDRRPFIMMRAGSPGSQRYGMIPWTGDVERSWDGFKPQVELALQMGLFGFGYIHSDLGGFAEGEEFDAELYTRWMQYGVFQPVYRAHAQEHIASEPVFHDERTREIVREFVRLRYRLMAYNYTLAFEHSRTGKPLMRPLFYLEPDNPDLIDERNSYLWGDAFLVAPVTEPGVESWPVNLPKGVWFDYFNGTRHEGGQLVDLPVSLETIPVMVRAGSFVPMVEVTRSTDDYSSKNLELHYWHDASVEQAEGRMYEDDGTTRQAHETGQFEHLEFSAEYAGEELLFNLNRSGTYPGMPESRQLELVIHQAPEKVESVVIDDQQIDIAESRPDHSLPRAWRGKNGRINVQMNWVDRTGLVVHLQ